MDPTLRKYRLGQKCNKYDSHANKIVKKWKRDILAEFMQFTKLKYNSEDSGKT